MRVSSYEIVTEFELDESVVLSLGPSIKKLQKSLGGILLPIRTPEDAPPPLPRLAMKYSDSLLKVSLDRLSISINPPHHVAPDINKASKFAFQRAESILVELLPVIPSYQWSGIIALLEFPTKSKEYNSAISAAKPAFIKLVNLQNFTNDLSNFQLQFGIKDNRYNRNYVISGFENRQIQVTGKLLKHIKVNLEEFPITECGIQIVIDINNRPGGAIENPLNDIKNILNRINSAYETLPKDLNLEDILK